MGQGEGPWRIVQMCTVNCMTVLEGRSNQYWNGVRTARNDKFPFRTPFSNRLNGAQKARGVFVAERRLEQRSEWRSEQGTERRSEWRSERPERRSEPHRS